MGQHEQFSRFWQRVLIPKSWGDAPGLSCADDWGCDGRYNGAAAEIFPPGAQDSPTYVLGCERRAGRR
eukprot:3474033-Pyramimonas_sp.AAC.1